MTYARPHAGFFHTNRTAGVSATHVGAAVHNVDGDVVIWNSLPLSLLATTLPSTMWTVACTMIYHKNYVHTKRRTLTQHQEERRETTRMLPAPDTNLKNAFHGPTNGVHPSIRIMSSVGS